MAIFRFGKYFSEEEMQLSFYKKAVDNSYPLIGELELRKQFLETYKNKRKKPYSRDFVDR